jgi:Uma2 family endonuclease
MSDTKATIIWEEFLAAGVEGQKCEWVDGEIVQMTPVNLRHAAIVSRLIASLFPTNSASSQQLTRVIQ